LEKEFTPTQVALAAASLLSAPVAKEDAVEIPKSAARDNRPTLRSVVADRQQRGGPAERQRAGTRPTGKGMSKVFFGIGRDANVAPRDLVGAIANEAGIPGKDIGAIDLTDRFALVEVPSDVAGYVVEVMQGTRIKGRKVNVRADRPPASTS